MGKRISGSLVSPFLAITLFVFNLATAQTPGSVARPINPVIIKMQAYGQWYLTVTSTHDAIKSEVIYEQPGLLTATYAEIAINDCLKMATALDAAADALDGAKPIKQKEIEGLTVDITIDKDNRQYIRILGTQKAFLFRTRLEQMLLPADARMFARSLRAVPDINANLRANIDNMAIWNGK